MRPVAECKKSRDGLEKSCRHVTPPCSSRRAAHGLRPSRAGRSEALRGLVGSRSRPRIQERTHEPTHGEPDARAARRGRGGRRGRASGSAGSPRSRPPLRTPAASTRSSKSAARRLRSAAPRPLPRGRGLVPHPRRLSQPPGRRRHTRHERRRLRLRARATYRTATRSARLGAGCCFTAHPAASRRSCAS